jgi:glycosyltransferase involved in cell wall biosynthesis
VTDPVQSFWGRPIQLGRCVVSCNAPYGDGGLGRHFREIIDALRSDGAFAAYFTGRLRASDPPGGIEVADNAFPFLARWTPLRFNRAALNHLHGDRHDRKVALILASMPAVSGDTFIGFGNQSLHSFAVAQRAGFKRLVLVAANSHVANVRRQHQRALNDYPLDGSWLNDAQFEKTLREYEQADLILCGSGYTLASMLENGVPREKLLQVQYRADARFVPRTDSDEVFANPRSPHRPFRIVYCGSVTPMKGVPLLVETFGQFDDDDAELHIVGNTSSRPMRRYIEGAMRRDSRIRMAAGDPLPVLQDAQLYIHPSYEDGFGYAAAEAIACGVPTIVTEDTGMKELIRVGVDGFVVPTGQIEPLLEQIRYHRQNASVSADNSAER